MPRPPSLSIPAVSSASTWDITRACITTPAFPFTTHTPGPSGLAGIYHLCISNPQNRNPPPDPSLQKEHTQIPLCPPHPIKPAQQLQRYITSFSEQIMKYDHTHCSSSSSVSRTYHVIAWGGGEPTKKFQDLFPKKKQSKNHKRKKNSSTRGKKKHHNRKNQLKGKTKTLHNQ
jgi:hypothetical protein